MSTPHTLPPTGPGAPTPAIAIAGGAGAASARLDATRVAVPDDVVERLRGACAEVTTDRAVLAEASRDWWPLGMAWATEGQVAGLAGAVARPTDAGQVAAVLAVCNEARLPVTAAGGRSGVCGASVPVHGGVVLDLTALAGIADVDATSLVLDVRAGTFGDVLERDLRADHGATLGHWPQSVALSTVGGWLACRSAGQLSGRYGKIEDIVLGLDVALADGSRITTGGWPRAAVGPDLTQLFVGSEGTLGIITGARLQLHPAPRHERRGAWLLPAFEDGLDTMRRIVQRGATPAVLRLYDAVEADRTYHTGRKALLLALDEGDPELVDTVMEVVAEECLRSVLPARRADAALVEQWLAHRNDVAALEALTSKGFTVDTMEISASWVALPGVYRATLDALLAVEGTIAASAHQSHSYPSGGCLYFTFAGQVGADERDTYYRTLWDAGQRAVLAHGGALSHHHGVGLNRARFMREALGPALDVLVATKRALDPRGILNPGKLGLPSPFGSIEGW
ncbi:MAG TPA: FAD-binding oxidoreductase [Acidimicrobiales bacterium]|nr:FAD-binding oxidoreductase [Acidimicrobiales bacterium]